MAALPEPVEFSWKDLLQALAVLALLLYSLVALDAVAARSGWRHGSTALAGAAVDHHHPALEPGGGSGSGQSVCAADASAERLATGSFRVRALQVVRSKCNTDQLRFAALINELPWSACSICASSWLAPARLLRNILFSQQVASSR